MKTLFVLCLLLILALGLYALPVYAYDQPVQTGNVTDVILWHGDTANIANNVTITSGTIIITGLNDAVAGIGTDVADAMSGAISNLTELAVMFMTTLGLASLAYWRNDRPLFMISGIAFILYGFSFFSTSTYFSVLLVLAGFFLFARAFTSRGIRQ